VTTAVIGAIDLAFDPAGLITTEHRQSSGSTTVLELI
jgi:hypothetical protein